MTLDLFEVHANENNPKSQRHLDENRGHFSAQCKKVFDILVTGRQLTVKSAMVDYNIQSLPRRILDLKKKGVVITDSWLIDTKPATKVWYMSAQQASQNKSHYEDINRHTEISEHEIAS